MRSLSEEERMAGKSCDPEYSAKDYATKYSRTFEAIS